MYPIIRFLSFVKSSIKRPDLRQILWRYFGYFIFILSSLLLLLAPPVSASYVPLVGISKVAGGETHSCALTSGGGVKCWGQNNYGQLGNGTFTDSSTPVDVSGLTNGVSAIVTGSAYTCALTSGGGVKCWGHNNNGQLGDGTLTDSSTPVDVSGLTSGVSAITGGMSHICALIVTSGVVKCWGRNDDGQLGDGSLSDRSAPFMEVSGLSGISVVAAGGYHTCVLTSLGGIQCWGGNSSGQLGDGSSTRSFSPVDVSGLTSGVSAIAMGSSHSCALTNGGGVKCWGYNVYGQLGNSSTSTGLTPVDVSGLTSGLSAIATGIHHSCAITNGGWVKCWGYNSFGQLGDGSTTDRSTPIDVSVSGLVSGVSAIGGGGMHTCTLAIGSGGVKCWGANGNGQLGNNNTTQHLTPVDVLVYNNPPTATNLSISLNPSGTPVNNVGEILKGNYTYNDVENDVESGTTFQWYQATNSSCSTGKTAISSATAQTYTVVSGDVDKYLCFGVTPVNANDTGAEVLATSSGVMTKIEQTINFTPPASDIYGGSATLNATATSSLTVSFSSATSSVCTVSGTTVNYVGAGTCTINADQVGDSNYNVAPQVSGNITVGKAPLTAQLNDKTRYFGAANPVFDFTYTGFLNGDTDAVLDTKPVGSTSATTTDPAGLYGINCTNGSDNNYDITCQNGTLNVVKSSVESIPTFNQTILFDTPIGQKQTKTLTLKNRGTSALIFNNINTPVAPFSYPKPMPFTFIPTGDPSGSPQSFEISCTPTEMDVKNMTLQITTNDPDNPTISYPLECMGRQAVAVSSVANNSTVSFGNALINSTLSQSITITENGNSDLILLSASITGTNAADFAITAPTEFPATVADGTTSSQIITVSCTPTTATPLTATLQITTNNPVNATLNYPLQCGGLFNLTLSTSGQGTISGCGTSCIQSYQQDAAVAVSATPATDWELSSWSGDCVNGQVVMIGNKSCGATFTQIVENTTTPSDTTTPTGTTPTNTTTTSTNTTNPTGTGTTTGSTSPTGTTTGNTTTSGTPIPTETPTGNTTTSSDSGSGNAVSVTATVPTSNGVVNGSMSNYNQVATNLTIPENSSVSGGTLAGAVTNSGLAANITIASNSTVTGGKLSGFNTNLGTLNNVTVSQYSEVRYGNYAGTTQNNGNLINPIVSPKGTIINNGTIEDPILLPGANVSGGKITGIIIALGGTYNSQVQPGARVITRVQDIPPQMFNNFNAQTLNTLPPTIISQITPEQFAQIPIESISGLSSENMGAISPEVIQSLDKEQIQELNAEEFKAMPTEEVAKLLTNFDAEQITPQEAEKLLPQRWTIDQYGNLTAPPGTRISVRSLNVANLPEGLKIPAIADLNSGFALGGKGSKTLISEMNQLSAQDSFLLSQQKSGVVYADVAGAVGSGRKSQFAFMIDPDQIFILDENALRGLQINEQGQYIIVTEDGKQIPITPMTKDPEALLTVLGENAEVDIQQTGEVLLKHQIIKRSRDGQEVHSVGMFDPFVEPAPEDICQEDANGEMQCDWSKADAAIQPGLRTARNVRAQSAAKVTYPDGSSQKIYPAVLFPDIFVAEAKKFAGVEKAIFRMDGTFAVTYQGVKLLLIPDSETQVQPIPTDKKFKPSLILQPDGKLLYQVSYLDQLFSTHLSISETPTS